MALSHLCVLVLVLTQVSYEAGGEVCEDDDVRLVGGDSLFEGRVEICRGGSWGRVCADLWNRDDATVVCRQLGFSDARSTRVEPPETGPIFLDNVECDGEEEMLASCISISEDIICYSIQDAGVECRGVIAELSRNGRSVHVEWNILDSSNVIILNFSHAVNTSGHQIIHSSIVTLSESETQSEYDGLLPAQNYSVCIHNYYAFQWKSTCTSIQIPPQSTTSINFVTSSSSSSCSITEGILGSIIALLVFLLIVAGVGLAYPRCIRHRVKDKKYLSNISQFLDTNMYLTSNEAYKIHSKRRHDRQRTERGAGTGHTNSNPLGTREAADQQYSVLTPTPGEPNHITATASDTVAQRYEMSSNTATINDTVAQHYEMSSSTLAQSRHYEVPAKDRNDEYSHLEH